MYLFGTFVAGIVGVELERDFAVGQVPGPPLDPCDLLLGNFIDMIATAGTPMASRTSTS
jgi:hypothetical protein